MKVMRGTILGPGLRRGRRSKFLRVSKSWNDSRTGRRKRYRHSARHGDDETADSGFRRTQDDQNSAVDRARQAFRCNSGHGDQLRYDAYERDFVDLDGLFPVHGDCLEHIRNFVNVKMD
jgi:hypothetical protein